MGDLPGGTFSSSAKGISADGKVIVGFGTTSYGEEAFRWTEETGMVSLGNLPDKSFKKSWVNKVSADGNVIVGYGDPVGQGWNTYKGFVWISSAGMREIGTLDTSSRSMAFCVSANGTIIAGDGGPAAFRWAKESQTNRMGVLPGRTHSRIIGMSAD
jgi:probable HAF family extracellular repeat protein